MNGGLLVDNLIRLLWVVVSMSLMACSAVTIKPDEPVVRVDKVLTARGYSRLQKLTHLTQQQNQFALEQAATINAYRKLGKLLYQEKLADNILVADQVIKSESFRIYADLFLREAKIIESNKTFDRKTIGLALHLTPRFYRCMSSSLAKVSQCLREDDKIQFTRIGYQKASVSTVNLSCYDCSSQLSVSGFSKEQNGMDKVMLEAGFYDVGWLGNMAASVLARYFILNNVAFE